MHAAQLAEELGHPAVEPLHFLCGALDVDFRIGDWLMSLNVSPDCIRGRMPQMEARKPPSAEADVLSRAVEQDGTDLYRVLRRLLHEDPELVASIRSCSKGNMVTETKIGALLPAQEAEGSSVNLISESRRKSASVLRRDPFSPDEMSSG